MTTAQDLLSGFAPEECDALTPLLRGAVSIVERFIGRRPHRSALHRWEACGTAGVRLRCVRVGRERFVSARMLAEFFAAAGAAAPPKKGAARRRDGRRAAANKSSLPTKAIGGRDE